MEIVVRNTQNTFKWLRNFIIFTLLLIVLGLVSCSSGESAQVTDQEENSAVVELAMVEVQETEEAAFVNEMEDAEAVPEETAVAEEPIDECLACHIDKEMLITTADPEEEVISENEGEG
jgi:hypothetical protein